MGAVAPITDNSNVVYPKVWWPQEAYNHGHHDRCPTCQRCYCCGALMPQVNVGNAEISWSTDDPDPGAAA